MEQTQLIPATVAASAEPKGREIGQRLITKVLRFLGENPDEHKVFINSKGLQVFVPPALRETISEGDFCIVVEKQYNSQGMVTDQATGQQTPKVDGAGNPVYDGAPFVRQDVIMAGDYDDVSAAFYEDDVIASMQSDRVKELATTFKAARKAAPKVIKPNGAPTKTEAEPIIGG